MKSFGRFGALQKHRYPASFISGVDVSRVGRAARVRTKGPRSVRRRLCLSKRQRSRDEEKSCSHYHADEVPRIETRGYLFAFRLVRFIGQLMHGGRVASSLQEHARDIITAKLFCLTTRKMSAGVLWGELDYRLLALRLALRMLICRLRDCA
jgi:hypothetical protein